ncbi:MAG TPA: VOC family protein [Candidatus Baltobacteraceae bacterium]|nr:VOC family protein [Candidatus Baltobacteraceae bacterium]
MAEQTVALRGLDVVFYTVKDMARARAFYEALFGVKPTAESEYWIEYNLPDGTTFALANDPQGGWKEGHGLMLGVVDREQAAQRAKQLGGTITDRSFEGASCGAYECIDPEGNYVYFHQRK